MTTPTTRKGCTNCVNKLEVCRVCFLSVFNKHISEYEAIMRVEASAPKGDPFLEYAAHETGEQLQLAKEALTQALLLGLDINKAPLAHKWHTLWTAQEEEDGSP
jgi:hypothetical protein